MLQWNHGTCSERSIYLMVSRLIFLQKWWIVRYSVKMVFHLLLLQWHTNGSIHNKLQRFIATITKVHYTHFGWNSSVCKQWYGRHDKKCHTRVQREEHIWETCLILHFIHYNKLAITIFQKWSIWFPKSGTFRTFLEIKQG